MPATAQDMRLKGEQKSLDEANAVQSAMRCQDLAAPAAVKRLIETMQFPLGGGRVELLDDLYNWRKNPDWHGGLGIFVDTESPCKVNGITQRGEFGFTYRRQTVNGKDYLWVQFADPDDSNSASRPSEFIR
jgi:hypothetical protein